MFEGDGALGTRKRPPFIGAGIGKDIRKMMEWRLIPTLVASRPRQFSCPKAIDMRGEKKKAPWMREQPWPVGSPTLDWWGH